MISKPRTLIVGAGPAGLAAAIQLQRYGLEPLLFEAELPGGLLHNANLVENYPGFPGGLPGTALASRMVEQARALNVKLTQGKIQKAAWDNGSFKLEATSGEHEADILLIASGTQPVRFPEEYVSPEAHPYIYYSLAPVFRIRGSKVVIIGGGDAAFDYALNLSKENEVTLLHRGSQANCLPLLWERASDCESINIIPGSLVNRIRRRDEGLACVHGSQGGCEIELDAHAVLIAIGRRPALDFLDASILQEQDALQASGKLYFIGDVKNGIHRQAVIAAGDGLRAAMQIYFKTMEVSI